MCDMDEYDFVVVMNKLGTSLAETKDWVLINMYNSFKL